MPKIGMEPIRKEQVIEATKRCIVRKGLANLSIKDIAAAAGVSTGIIYHYFENKEDVLLQVLKESFRTSHEKVMQTVEPLPNPVDKFFAHLENINAVPKDNPEFYIVLLNYLGQSTHNPQIRKIVTKFFYNLRSYTENYLRIKTEADPTAACHLKNLPVILYALGLGLGIMWTLDNDFYDIEEMGESLKEWLAKYLDLTGKGPQDGSVG
ncbi:TetR/AcrR family transcriptional regulator [Effusibacillus pohliae]|uniref:TetR/AcrR family transcriptional regulator n=1 Tax=Effusibacillus pohliae TaxID=232270 RepID=UPI0003A24D85|nr:TetR/AcrR family transcriptional regulator [Effusibacillus pohliae]